MVDVGLLQEPRARNPLPSRGRIHDLKPSAMAAPGEDKVDEAAGMADHHDAGEEAGFAQHHVIERHENLLGIQTEHQREIFERVDRRPIPIRPARLADPLVIDGDPETAEQRGEGGRSTIGRRDLNDLGNEKAAIELHVKLSLWGADAPRGRWQCDERARSSEHQRGGRDVLDRNLEDSRQAMSKRRRKRRVGLDLELYPDDSIPWLAPDTNDTDRDAAVLG